MRLTLMLLVAVSALRARAAPDAPMAFIDEQIAAHAGETGTYVMEKGEEALLARAWLADHAEKSIDVQYFIWSTDNVGILAAESLLRAAERGVRVRIIVDDLLIDAPPKSLLALALHPKIEIRIYNPKKSVGVPLQARLLNVLADFRGFNQRMHNKVFIVDGKVAITGGRNMADEYFDYDHEYNFRDRDALLVGDVVPSMRASFETFWESPLSVKVEELYDGIGLLQQNVRVEDRDVQKAYQDLHGYASSPIHFAPSVRAAIDGAPRAFPRLARAMAWGRVELISDRPGKNDARLSLSGGGLTGVALARLVDAARNHVVIQTPYLVLSGKAMDLFLRTRARGVRVRIDTNSLAATDNLPAFGGYRFQRAGLLRKGVEIYEYRPHPEEQGKLVQRSAAAKGEPTVVGLHAKSMVVDSKVVYIGTFNLDPRSENLNTEVGVIIHNETLAREVEAAIETDMKPGNSWNAATDDPDRFASLRKRREVWLWQFAPIKPIL
jgi:putative cardiolipin synthase